MSQPKHKLTDNFAAFFKRLNPSPTYENAAATAHSQITSLIEDRTGPAGDLRTRCFLQGSYRRDTAIHTINDVDVVALCTLSYTPSANRNTRNQIIRMMADAIAVNETYRDVIRYRDSSICIKVLLQGIKIEVLPALRVRGKPFDHEPFFMFRPDDGSQGEWQHAYAREHQLLCSEKNASVDGLFVPMIKVVKHLRSLDSSLADEDAVSFHIECLLYAITNAVYAGSTCECIEAVLKAIDGFTPDKAERSTVTSPCRDKTLFSKNEWDIDAYRRFHKSAVEWHRVAAAANQEVNRNKAIDGWKQLLGDNYFPRNLE